MESLPPIKQSKRNLSLGYTEIEEGAGATFVCGF